MQFTVWSSMSGILIFAWLGVFFQLFVPITWLAWDLCVSQKSNIIFITIFLISFYDQLKTKYCVCLSMSLSLYIHRGRRIFFKGFAMLCCRVSTVAHNRQTKHWLWSWSFTCLYVTACSQEQRLQERFYLDLSAPLFFFSCSSGRILTD